MGFSLDILTPSKILAKNLALDSMLIPTISGDINILENHTHLITKVEPGMVRCFIGESKKVFTVTVGVCKIIGNKITILTSVGEEARVINVERAEKALEKAQEVLAKTDNLSDQQILKYRRKLERAKMRIEAFQSTKNS